MTGREGYQTARLQLRSAEVAGSYVVAAAGELDLHACDLLHETLERIIGTGGRRVIVDLTDVCLVDSTALGVLTLAHKRLRAGGGTLLLVSNDPRTLRILQVTGLDRVLPLERSLAGVVGNGNGIPA